MLKSLSLISIVSICLGLSACNNSSNSNKSDGTPSPRQDSGSQINDLSVCNQPGTFDLQKPFEIKVGNFQDNPVVITMQFQFLTAQNLFVGHIHCDNTRDPQKSASLTVNSPIQVVGNKIIFTQKLEKFSTGNNGEILCSFSVEKDEFLIYEARNSCIYLTPQSGRPMTGVPVK